MANCSRGTRRARRQAELDDLLGEVYAVVLSVVAQEVHSLQQQIDALQSGRLVCPCPLCRAQAHEPEPIEVPIPLDEWRRKRA